MLKQPETPLLSPPDGDKVFNLIYGCGNLEAKLLLAGELQRDQEPRTAQELATSLSTAQGENPPWPIDPKTVMQYCTTGLVPYGIAEEVTVNSRKSHAHSTAQAWSLNSQDADLKLAFFGFVGSWSLQHPAFSIQQLWGVTSNNSHVKYPRVKHAICETILAASRLITKSDLGVIETMPDEGATTKEDLWEIIGGPPLLKRESFRTSLATLMRTGIIISRGENLFIADEALAAARGLIKGVASLQKGRGIAKYTKAARQILPKTPDASTEAFANIMAKGRQFSRRHNAISMRALELRILDVIKDHGQITIEECCVLLNREVHDYGLTVGYAVARDALATLTEQGIIKKQPHDRRRGTGGNRYTL